MTYEKVLKLALSLSEVERSELMERLRISLIKYSESIERLWDAEAMARHENYKQGKTTARDVEEVLKKYKK